ncbi:MAG: MBL fold metallo-hydrolase [Acidobacteria bacterium]|nr:MBL fold metallo-hydrolase [Acidobacteriota bacterium]
MRRRDFLASLAAAPLAPGVEFAAGPVNSVVLGGQLTLLTHYRRDALPPVRGTTLVGPRSEHSETFWRGFQAARFHDYAQQSSRIPVEPVPVAKLVAPGERFTQGGVSVEVAATPGYARGAVSYLLESGGRRLAVTGDLIYGDGQLLDLYSLQDAIPEAKVRGYHGYAARAADLVASLRRIAAWRPDVILPARGPAIEHPLAAIDKLIRRIEDVFRGYYSVDALRWYWGDDNLRTRARRVLGEAVPEWMPMAETVREKLPEWLVAVQNTRVILSRTGAAFLVDCGSRKILEQVRSRRVEGMWITHYHDDHTDCAQAAAESFGCPVYACGQMKEILENPAAYRLPAQTANPIRNVKATRPGEKLRWHEFEFTFSYFPGQTLYHGGLHIRRDTGEEIFFLGDSFTPSGLDDYCLLNRNLLRRGAGYLECLRVLREERPAALLVNQHVAPLFRFSRQQLDFMQAALERRMRTFAELFPWPDINYGLDEQWARFHPYELRAGPARVVIWNHSPRREEYRITPRAWGKTLKTLRLTLDPGREGAVSFALQPPPGFAGLEVVTAGVAFGRWDLRQWCEALVDVRS